MRKTHLPPGHFRQNNVFCISFCKSLFTFIVVFNEKSEKTNKIFFSLFTLRQEEFVSKVPLCPLWATRRPHIIEEVEIDFAISREMERTCVLSINLWFTERDQGRMVRLYIDAIHTHVVYSKECGVCLGYNVYQWIDFHTTLTEGDVF